MKDRERLDDMQSSIGPEVDRPLGCKHLTEVSVGVLWCSEHPFNLTAF